MIGSRYLLDANAIIALQRQDAPLLKLLSVASQVFVPVVAIGELYYGAYKSQKVEANRQSVAAFVVGRVILDVDVYTADVYDGLALQKLLDYFTFSVKLIFTHGILYLALVLECHVLFLKLMPMGLCPRKNF